MIDLTVTEYSSWVLLERLLDRFYDFMDGKYTQYNITYGVYVDIVKFDFAYFTMIVYKNDSNRIELRCNGHYIKFTTDRKIEL